ncbi:hypothetical protein MMC06_000467 [Schaereria dolodes]|nr:hypothetical protein [Schaereria dolodes]
MANKMTWDGNILYSNHPPHLGCKNREHIQLTALIPPCLCPKTDLVNDAELCAGAADQQLLLSILAEHDIKLDFDAVSKRLGCTARAVQERLKKLKKLATDEADGSSITPAKASTKKASSDEATPTKKRKVVTPKSPKVAKASTGKGKGKKVKEDAKTSAADGGIKDIGKANGVKRGHEEDEHETLAETDFEEQDVDVKHEEGAIEYGENEMEDEEV